MNNLEKLENFDKWLAEYNCEDVYSLAEKLQQRIAELETKLEEVEGQYAYECGCNEQLVKLQEENAKLQEQLKNAILSKFKIGDEIYHIRNWNGEILKAKVKSISVCINEYNTNFEYGLSDWFECEKDKRYYNFVSSVADEEFVFATEAEAQKYLEGRK